MNQDYIFTSEQPVGNLSNLFIVADGMGGYSGGGFASSYAVEIICRTVTDSLETNPLKIFDEAIKRANEAVRDKASQSEELEKMGTTAVLATIFGDVLQVANVGDSRLYIVSDDIRQITVDHSYVEEMVKIGSLDRESARNHPQKNIITRAVGADKDITPDFFTVKLKPGDKVLMCSDGLSNMIEDEDILLILKREKDLAGKATELVRVANENGGKDNVAVIIIDPFAE